MKRDRTQENSLPNLGKRNPVKYKLILSSLVLFVLAVGFNTLFTSTALQKLYIDANISEYRVILKDLHSKIETGLYYGKSLMNYVGIEKLLSAEKERILRKITRKSQNFIDFENQLQDQDIVISIAQLDGTILHSDDQKLIGTKLPESVWSDQIDGTNKGKRFKSTDFTKDQDSYFTSLFISDRQKKRVGIICIALKEKQIRAFLEKAVENSSITIISIAAISIIALVVLLALLPMDQRRFSKKTISFIIFFIICLAQVLSSGYMTLMFKDHFLEINKDNSEVLTAIVERDTQYLLNNGVGMNQLVNMDRYLERIIQGTPELNDITLYDHNNYPLYRATKAGATDFQKSKNAYTQWMEATKPLTNTEFNTKVELNVNNRYRGYISTNTSRTILYKRVFEIAMDSLTVLVISILFLVEMLILVFKYLEKQVLQEVNAGKFDGISYGVMRPAVFLLLFGVDISISFIPLHMQKLYIPFLGLSKDTIIGLPISVEFMFVGIAILISGVWLDRRGWHEPFIVGLLLASIGFGYSCVAPDALNFILSRAIVGLGYGLALMASQGFVITYSDNRNKAQGLAHLFAGIYAGSICGGATGAMLAETVGYNATFLFGSAILLLVIGYALIFMRRAMEKPASRQVTVRETAPRPVKTVSNVFHFLTNRIVLSLIFFSSLPAAIAAVGFLNYFLPVYLNRIGVAQATIGQVLMIYGICLIYIGPLVSKYVDSTRDKKRYVFVGCILGSVAFLTFYIVNGLVSAMIAIMLLGLSSSFVLASQSVYALRLKVTQKLGEGKAIGIFRSTSRIGQMLGPITFSWLFAVADTNQGIMFFGLAYLLTAILFILLTQKDYTNLVMDDV